MDALRVRKSGLASSLQDDGRRTGLDKGVPSGGAADSFAYRLGNVIVGNQAGTPAVELMFLGGEFEALTDVVFVLTGADFGATIAGRPVKLAIPGTLRRGETLLMGPARSGCFGYLAIRGGFQATEAFGSYSTYTPGRLGGFAGRLLRNADVLEVGEQATASEPIVCAAQQHDELCAPPSKLRFIPGPQLEYFDKAAYATFVGEPYRVSNRSNRMGYRLEGRAYPKVKAIERTADGGAGPTDIIEEGNAVGGIQFAGGKQLICLGRDCGTTGGYAKIGCLISADVSRMAQLRPNDVVRFALTTIDEARQVRREYEELLASVSGR